jgi:hypothetical protein
VDHGVFFVGGVGCKPGWIIEAVVHDPGFCGKGRTGFIGITTDGDHVIEFVFAEFLGCLALVTGDIDADLAHGLYGKGIEAVLFDTRGVGFHDISPEVAAQALGHLTAAGITGAEEK